MGAAGVGFGATGAAAGAGAGGASGSAFTAGGGAGLLPPIFKLIVGGFAGASVCVGLSIGCISGGGGWRGACGWANLNRPGTNSDAPMLSLLMMIVKKMKEYEKASRSERSKSEEGEDEN